MLKTIRMREDLDIDVAINLENESMLINNERKHCYTIR